jgi:hypothetical protein
MGADINTVRVSRCLRRQALQAHISGELAVAQAGLHQAQERCEAAEEAQRQAERAAAQLQARLRWAEADEAQLADATTQRLGHLVDQLEARLSRARAAQLQVRLNMKCWCAACTA